MASQRAGKFIKPSSVCGPRKAAQSHHVNVRFEGDRKDGALHRVEIPAQATGGAEALLAMVESLRTLERCEPRMHLNEPL